MSRKSSKQAEVAPRKRPSQARAQATVESILEATAHILVEGGYAALTTNRVAKTAGVSIGSFYQYFPGKEALLVALVERHSQRYLARVAAAFTAAMELPLDQAVRATLRAIVASLQEAPALYRVFFQELSRVQMFDPIRQIDRQMESLIKAVVELRAPGTYDSSLIAFAVVQCTKAVTLGALVERPEYLEEDRIVAVLERMILGILSPCAPARRRNTDSLAVGRWILWPSEHRFSGSCGCRLLLSAFAARKAQLGDVARLPSS